MACNVIGCTQKFHQQLVAETVFGCVVFLGAPGGARGKVHTLPKGMGEDGGRDSFCSPGPRERSHSSHPLPPHKEEVRKRVSDEPGRQPSPPPPTLRSNTVKMFLFPLDVFLTSKIEDDSCSQTDVYLPTGPLGRRARWRALPCSWKQCA